MMDYLLDDYIILYLETNDKKYLSKSIIKLLECGFNNETALEIINTEIDIIKFRKNIEKPIINQYYWFGRIKDFKDNSNFRVFSRDINDYLMLRYDTPKATISQFTLTLSELCLIFDEAWIISHRFNNEVPKSMYDECISIAKYEGMKSWIIREFKTRIEEIYRKVNHKKDENKLLAGREIDNLYKKELNILLTQRDYNKFI